VKQEKVEALHTKHACRLDLIGYYECRDGWFDLIDALYCCLPEGVAVRQVKEKYGTLAVYVSMPEGLDPLNRAEAYGAIRMAEAMSSRLCEVCGQQGRKRGSTRTWIETLCDAHAAAKDGGA